MAAVTCKYHTQTPARWRCDSCQINFCPSCVKLTGNRPPDCPVCKRELTSLGAANMIKPFWSRLRQFFLYPLHAGPLIVILGLTLVSFLIAHVPGWYLKVDFVLWRMHRYDLYAMPFYFIFLKYAQSVLEDTARGHLKPLPLSSEKLTENGLIVVKLFSILTVFKLIEFSALDLFGQLGLQLAEIILVFATPAAIMLLAMEDKLLSALNPAMVGSLIMRIGPTYLLLFALLYVMEMTKAFLFGMLIGELGKLGEFNPPVAIASYTFIRMYFSLVTFGMMGYLLYQHHEQLGFDIDVEVEELPEKSGKAREPETSPEMRAVEILIQEGKTEDAVRQLEGIIRNSPTEIEARERLLKLARLIGNMALHREQGQSYISYLLSEGKLTQAVKVYQACNEYDKSFRPAKPGERLELGKFLRQNGQPRLAMALLNNLHKDFPSYENVPEAYLMVAQMLCEQFNEDARARQVLQFIQQNYPSHPMLGAVQDYLRIVDDVSNH